MIDTISIQTSISQNIYNIVYNNSVIKSSFCLKTGEKFYEIVNGHLEGSYSSSISVRVFQSGEGYQMRVEGSYHKVKLGYNSHNGFTDLIYVSNMLISLVEFYYQINLPQIDFWFANRVDITNVFDLSTQEDVVCYINNLKRCVYPRRQALFYGSGIYFSGSVTTLKIYNKLLEFKKHDMKKFKDTDFDLFSYLDTIKGFVRFECEVKKRKLLSFYNKEKNVKIIDINYNDLEKIWRQEFMKVLKLCENELVQVNEKDKIKILLYNNFPKRKAKLLYDFYNTILVDGLESVKNDISSSTYYRNLKYLKTLNIDFSQTCNIVVENRYINFNPFTAPKVA